MRRITTTLASACLLLFCSSAHASFFFGTIDTISADPGNILNLGDSVVFQVSYANLGPDSVPVNPAFGSYKGDGSISVTVQGVLLGTVIETGTADFVAFDDFGGPSFDLLTISVGTSPPNPSVSLVFNTDSIDPEPGVIFGDSPLIPASDVVGGINIFPSSRFGARIAGVDFGGFITGGRPDVPPTVPEPSSLIIYGLLSCIGLVGLGWRRSRAK